MFALRTWSRAILATFVLTFFAPATPAEHNITQLAPRSTDLSPESGVNGSPKNVREHAGNPALGVMIILGVVGFLIFVAWVFSRVGEGNRHPTDNTMD